MYVINSWGLMFPDAWNLREIAFNVTVFALVCPFHGWSGFLVLMLLSSRDLRDVYTEKSVQLDFFTLETHSCLKMCYSMRVCRFSKSQFFLEIRDILKDKCGVGIGSDSIALGVC